MLGSLFLFLYFRFFGSISFNARVAAFAFVFSSFFFSLRCLPFSRIRSRRASAQRSRISSRIFFLASTSTFFCSLLRKLQSYRKMQFFGPLLTVPAYANVSSQSLTPSFWQSAFRLLPLFPQHWKYNLKSLKSLRITSGRHPYSEVAVITKLWSDCPHHRRVHGDIILWNCIFACSRNGRNFNSVFMYKFSFFRVSDFSSRSFTSSSNQWPNFIIKQIRSKLGISMMNTRFPKKFYISKSLFLEGIEGAEQVQILSVRLLYLWRVRPVVHLTVGLSHQLIVVNQLLGSPIVASSVHVRRGIRDHIRSTVLLLLFVPLSDEPVVSGCLGTKSLNDFFAQLILISQAFLFRFVVLELPLFLIRSSKCSPPLLQ